MSSQNTVKFMPKQHFDHSFDLSQDILSPGHGTAALASIVHSV
jgi:hypothetical protein